MFVQSIHTLPEHAEQSSALQQHHHPCLPAWYGLARRSPSQHATGVVTALPAHGLAASHVKCGCRGGTETEHHVR